MTVFLAILILTAPFALAVTLSWVVKRSPDLRPRADRYRVPNSVWDRLFDVDPDAARIDHDLDAIRTRFEKHPAWPSSGALGERR